MKLRPTIFLSGVSSEFASFRDAVEAEVQKKDCFPLNQSSFGVDYRTIEEILRRNIGEADAVIHIVGFRFGFEPRDRPEGKPRRSYTQMEYDIARELNKPVYVFLSADPVVCDPNPGEQPEDAEAIQLQLAHRKVLEQSNTIRYSFQNKTDLCLRAANIPLLATADFRVDISRIDRYAPAELIGRESELKLLDDAWLKMRRGETNRAHILTFVALGGEGKTSLVAKWAAQLAYENWPGCDSAFAWSFYSQGFQGQSTASSDLFIKEATTFFGNDSDREFAASNAGAYEKGQRLARIVGRRRSLLILDGIESLQNEPTTPMPGELKDPGVAAMLKGLAADNDGLCIVTTRYSLPDLRARWRITAPEVSLTRLSLEAGVHLLKSLGVTGSTQEIEKAVEDTKGHALTLNLLGTYLRDVHEGDISRYRLVLEKPYDHEQSSVVRRVIQNVEDMFSGEPRLRRPLAILKVVALFDRPAKAIWMEVVCKQPVIPGLTELMVGKTALELCADTADIGQGIVNSVGGNWGEVIDPDIQLSIHPAFAQYLRDQVRSSHPEGWREAHLRLCMFFTQKLSDEMNGIDDLATVQLALYHGGQGGVLSNASLKDWILNVSKSVRRARSSSSSTSSAKKSSTTPTVFICYRRSGEASYLARTIRAELRRRGCDVFLDVDSLRTGLFDDALLHEIESAENFLVILSPNCLERSASAGDWFRTELAYALTIDRNIIPIMMDGFEWPEPEQLPQEIRSARRYNGLRYSHDYFEAMMDKVDIWLKSTRDESHRKSV